MLCCTPYTPHQPHHVKPSPDYSSLLLLPRKQNLVLASSGLASLQLLQVPVANLHVAAVVVHAFGELLRGG